MKKQPEARLRGLIEMAEVAAVAEQAVGGPRGTGKGFIPCPQSRRRGRRPWSDLREQ